MNQTRILILLLAGVLIFLGIPLFSSQSLLPGDLLEKSIPLKDSKSTLAQNYSLSDVIEQLYPYQHFLRSELARGRIPLWNPYVLCGSPFVANTVSAVFFPLNWPLLLIPHDQAYEWSALLKFLLAGGGIYLFCLRLDLSQLAAGFSAATFMFSGYLVYFLLFPNSWVAALLGWTLLAVERVNRQLNVRNISLLGLMFGLALLSGHVESGVLLAVAAGLYGMIRNWRLLPALSASVLAGVALSSIVSVPFLEFLTNSATFLQRSDFPRNPYHLDWSLLPGFVVPYFPGSPVDSPGFSGAFTGSIYLGLVPFLLLLFSRPHTSKRQFGALAGLLFFSFTILFGVPPVFDLFTALPVLRQGNHMHILQILHGSLAILAGFGLHHLERSTRRRLWLFLAAGLPILIATSWIYLRNNDASGSFFFISDRYEMPGYLLLTLVIFAGLALLWNHRTLATGLLITAIANGILFGIGFNPIVKPDENLGIVPSFVQELQEFPHARVAAVGVGFFPPDYPMRWEVRDFRGYESVVPSRHPSYYRYLTGGQFNPHQFVKELNESKLRLLVRAGCSFVLTTSPLSIPGLHLIREGFPLLYGVAGPGRVHWARNIVSVTGTTASLQHVQFEPDPATVAIEGAEFVDAPMNSPSAGESIEWISDQPDRVELRVHAKTDAWLVLRDSWFPGWRAFVGNQETRIFRADFLFRAIQVPAGEHTIRFDYRPRPFFWGALLSIITALLLISLSFIRQGGTFLIKEDHTSCRNPETSRQ